MNFPLALSFGQNLIVRFLNQTPAKLMTFIRLSCTLEHMLAWRIKMVNMANTIPAKHCHVEIVLWASVAVNPKLRSHYIAVHAQSTFTYRLFYSYITFCSSYQA